jgi:hypothetical protein
MYDMHYTLHTYLHNYPEPHIYIYIYVVRSSSSYYSTTLHTLLIHTTSYLRIVVV